MLSRELLDILRCPRCGGELRHDEMKHLLRCIKCAKGYAVVDDIPILMADETTARKNVDGAGRER